MIEQIEYIEKTMKHIVYCWGIEYSPEIEQAKWSNMQVGLAFLLNCLPEKHLNKQWADFTDDVLFLMTIAFQRGLILKLKGDK